MGDEGPHPLWVRGLCSTGGWGSTGMKDIFASKRPQSDNSSLITGEARGLTVGK